MFNLTMNKNNIIPWKKKMRDPNRKEKQIDTLDYKFMEYRRGLKLNEKSAATYTADFEKAIQRAEV